MQPTREQLQAARDDSLANEARGEDASIPYRQMHGATRLAYGKSPEQWKAACEWDDTLRPVVHDPEARYEMIDGLVTGESEMSDRQVAELICNGPPDGVEDLGPYKGDALRSRGFRVTDEQAVALIDKLQLGEAQEQQAAAQRLMRTGRIDPEAEQSQEAVRTFVAIASKVRDDEPEQDTYTIRTA